LVISRWTWPRRRPPCRPPGIGFGASISPVEQLDRDKIGWAEAVGVSVPMHTAMRLAIGAGEQIRAIRPRLPICFYGLYAAVSDDPTIGGLVDRLIAGEYESELVAWVEALDDSPAVRPATSSIDLGRHTRVCRPRHFPATSPTQYLATRGKKWRRPVDPGGSQGTRAGFGRAGEPSAENRSRPR
jgi:hypothetical protein